MEKEEKEEVVVKRHRETGAFSYACVKREILL